MRLTLCLALLCTVLPAKASFAQDYKAVIGAPVVELAANWGRDVMPSLADKRAEDGTVYMELPLVRVYNAQGQRLKLPASVTTPRYTAAELNAAIYTMEVDEDASSLSEDLALLEDATGASFGATSALPSAQAYVVNYGAEWCRTSKPFDAALLDWQKTARDVVVIRANANFGTSSNQNLAAR
jgi:hypothetical protein